jgi:hypothetical protein
VIDSETLRKDVTTVHGLDTGEILDSGNPAATALKRFIYSQIEARLRNLPEADHPFAASMPRKWRTMSWGVKMWREGYQVPHIHSKALLKPNPQVLNLFHGFPDWSRVVSTEEIDTVKLDSIPEAAGVDLLKMDIQGAEQMVLKNAKKRLKDMLVMQLEVEFLPMYVDQPLFGDLDVFLRKQGFVFHKFFPTVSRTIKPMMVNNNMYAGFSQILWADAIFVRDFTRPEKLSARQLLAICTILHDCYQSFDLVLNLLQEYDKKAGKSLAPGYLPALKKSAGA